MPSGWTLIRYSPPSNTSYSGNTPLFTARRTSSMDSAGSVFQPVGHGAWARKKRKPSMRSALRILAAKSSGWAIESVPAYGTPWAAMIAIMSFLRSPLPRGVVVVRAAAGVAELRWPPVLP